MKNITLETCFVKIEISGTDSKVLSIVDKRDDTSIMGEETFFFRLADKEDNAFEIKSVTLSDGVILVDTAVGPIEVGVALYDEWYSLEVLTSLPKEAYRFAFGSLLFNYDLDDENALRAADVSMTVNANPCFYPSGSNREVRGECQEHLGGAMGAKIGFTVVPHTILRETLKTVCEHIDPDKGIISKNAGAWARDSRIAFGSYMFSMESTPEFIQQNLPLYREMGVDQIDFHQGAGTILQGNFKYMRYDTHEAWRENVIKPLRENGLEAGLHTYAYYINEACHELLSDPKWQKMLDMEEVFTLAEDVSADADFFPSVESTADLSDYYGFFTRNLPYFLIGEEIVRYTNHPQGFKTCVRGIGGTKPAAHKKGEKMHHLIGCFNLFSPKPSSELFKKIAHNTADAYNNGDYAMIYLDALDGIGRHCDRSEAWYYCAVFVHEIVKNCKVPPIIEYSTMYPSIWAARARMGAWDTPFRAYKYFNNRHHRENSEFVDCHYACTLGWYNYYPTTDTQPGNYHTKYHHWDAIDHMGALSVLYDYSTVFNSNTHIVLKRYAAYERNVKRYKELYSDLRKSFYFSNDILEKARASEHELAIVKKGKKFFFVEKNYDVKRFYDIQDEKRNTAVFENPFKRQTPFIRLEADMSTLGADPIVLMPLDENKPISEQLKSHEFGCELDLNSNLVYTVRVKGNGKKGAIGIKTRCASQSEFGYGLYIIETDFEGWREFALCECDNGERPDFSFDKKETLYPIYRSGLQTGRATKVELEADGDIEGVQMSSIKACRQVYNVVKNPTVTIGKENVMFECELMSTDFIEWDGERAVVIDRYGNEKKIWFQGTLNAPKGRFKATVGCQASLNNCPVNLHLTVGTTGNIIK